MQAERKELENHKSNSSWTTISASEVPAGRRIHKLIWVYKLKPDGTAKARLCVLPGVCRVLLAVAQVPAGRAACVVGWAP